MSEPFAYELDGQRVAREHFYAIACDPRRSVAVEACAGAGKTWMLVSRMLRALLEGTPPHQILAITFTKKAAGEMRERLHQWLADFANADDATLRLALTQRGLPVDASSPLPARLKGLYREVLAAGRPVQIRTFHSWFAALLRSAPLAALEQLGLPARHELLEDDAEAIALVWRRFWDTVADDASLRADYEASVAAHGRTQTQKALHAALDKRVEFALADDSGVLAASVQPWNSVFPDLAEVGGVAEPRALIATPGPLRELLAEAAVLLGRATQTTFRACGENLERALTASDFDGVVAGLFTKDGSARKFSDKLAGLAQVRAAQEALERLRAACAQHEAWQHQDRMVRLARALLADYAALKRERGWVDMNDVERAAQVLLSDPVLSGWVQERLDARVGHLLVDEFQDTNPLQWQALHAWLSGYAGAGGGGDAPSVFLVGDPKQSIYRFRRAEPQVFRAAQAFVVQGLGGALLSCDHTHRNARAVLGTMNQAMAAAQAAGEYEGFREHTTESAVQGAVWKLPAIPRPPRAARGSAEPELEWRDSLSTPRESPEERLVTLECRQAARWIAARLDSGLAPQDVMVLARRRDRLVVMEDELRTLGIPSQQPEKTRLGEAPEVQDVVALLDVLVSPTHDLSLARALRSPIFGLPDEGLVALASRARAARAEGPPRPWLELLQAEPLPLPGFEALGETLMRWKRWVERLPPHDALDAIFHDGDVLARYAQSTPAAARPLVLARLRALLGAALEVSGGRYATPYAFVRAMRAGSVQAPAAADASAVRLLTVHGAKGLEARLVLLLDTDGAAARAETMGVLVDWPGEAPTPQRFAFLASESRPPTCCVDAMQIEQAARSREELNGLYVAVTRARAELAISSVEPHVPASGSWWQRLEPLCAPVPEATLAEAPSLLADRQAGCSLAIVPTLPATPAAEPVVPTRSKASARFGQALHRLLECWPAGGDMPPALLQSLGRQFTLAPGAVGEALSMAERILRGEGAWAWDGEAIDWCGNEVELLHRGELLRLDRLVRRRADGQWWVLDYKSAALPEQDESLLAQLRRYREAVEAAHPGARVRAAFLTGQGRLVTVD